MSFSPFTHQTVSIDQEEALQTSIRIGKTCINRLHRNYPTFVFLNTILGGYFGSRLMQSIREEKGYTYGIRSSIKHTKNRSYFYIASDLIKEHKEKAIEEIKKEIGLLKNLPLNQDEIDLIKNYIKGDFLSSLSNPFDISGRVKSLLLADLPTNYYVNMMAEIDSITSEDILKSASENLNVDQFSFISVG